MFLIIMGILGAVGYGGYMYYKDTQQRIMTLKENNAKLEVAEQMANETINTMMEDREKMAELNKELQGKLQPIQFMSSTGYIKNRPHSEWMEGFDGVEFDTNFIKFSLNIL